MKKPFHLKQKSYTKKSISNYKNIHENSLNRNFDSNSGNFDSGNISHQEENCNECKIFLNKNSMIEKQICNKTIDNEFSSESKEKRLRNELNSNIINSSTVEDKPEHLDFSSHDHTPKCFPFQQSLSFKTMNKYDSNFKERQLSNKKLTIYQKCNIRTSSKENIYMDVIKENSRCSNLNYLGKSKKNIHEEYTSKNNQKCSLLNIGNKGFKRTKNMSFIHKKIQDICSNKKDKNKLILINEDQKLLNDEMKSLKIKEEMNNKEENKELVIKENEELILRLKHFVDNSKEFEDRMKKEKYESRINIIKSRYLYLLVSKIFLNQKLEKNIKEEWKKKINIQRNFFLENISSLYKKINEIREFIKEQLNKESNYLTTRIISFNELNSKNLYVHSNSLITIDTYVENDSNDLKENRSNLLIENKLNNLNKFNKLNKLNKFNNFKIGTDNLEKPKFRNIVDNDLKDNSKEILISNSISISILTEKYNNEITHLKEELSNKINEIEIKNKEILQLKNESMEKENDLKIKLETETIDFLSKSENYIKKINELSKENDEWKKIKVR